MSRTQLHSSGQLRRSLTGNEQLSPLQVKQQEEAAPVTKWMEDAAVHRAAAVRHDGDEDWDFSLGDGAKTKGRRGSDSPRFEMNTMDNIRTEAKITSKGSVRQQDGKYASTRRAGSPSQASAAASSLVEPPPHGDASGYNDNDGALSARTSFTEVMRRADRDAEAAVAMEPVSTRPRARNRAAPKSSSTASAYATGPSTPTSFKIDVSGSVYNEHTSSSTRAPLSNHNHHNSSSSGGSRATRSKADVPIRNRDIGPSSSVSQVGSPSRRRGGGQSSQRSPQARSASTPATLDAVPTHGIVQQDARAMLHHLQSSVGGINGSDAAGGTCLHWGVSV